MTQAPFRRPDRSRAERGVAEGPCLNDLRLIAETRSLQLASLKRGGYPARVGTTGDLIPTHPALAAFTRSTDGQRREIVHHDFLRRRVQHGAAQLPAIARVSGLAGRAGIDHQHPIDTTD